MVHDLWWGPPWVSLNHEEWPQRDSSNGEPDVTEEVIACVSTPRKSPESVVSLKNYSSYNRPVRVVAWIKRFVSNCSNPGGRVTSPHLTVEELGNAEVYVLKHAQMDDFQNELNLINSGNNLPKNSKLLPLHPYLDNDGLLRVKGRLEHSSLPDFTKHPIILSATHPVAKLIIRAEHLRLLHSGPSLTLSFHLIGGKRVVRSTVRQCAVCRRKSS